MRLLYSMLALTLCVAGCGSEPSLGADVELWVEGDLSRVEGLESVEFTIRDAHLQPAGFEIYPDHRITSEWRTMQLDTSRFEFLATGSLPMKIASLRVEEGEFDRVFLRPSLLGAETTEGQSLIVKNVMEPIAAQFETDGGTVRILLKMIVLPTSRGDEDISIFAQDTEVLLD